MLGLARAEGVAVGIMRVADMIHAGQTRGPKILRLAAMPPTDKPPKFDAVIAALAADQARARRLAAHAVIGEGDLQRHVSTGLPTRSW